MMYSTEFESVGHMSVDWKLPTTPPLNVSNLYAQMGERDLLIRRIVDPILEKAADFKIRQFTLATCYNHISIKLHATEQQKQVAELAIKAAMQEALEANREAAKSVTLEVCWSV